MNGSPRDPCSQNAVDIQNARSRTTINVSEVRNIVLYNGTESWKRHKSLVSILSRDPIFDKSQRDFMDRTQRYKRGLRMTNRLFELQKDLNWSKEETNIAISLMDDALPINLHNTAFEPVFTLQAGPELLAKYGALVANRGILGCYLQTELGHGSNVANLETIATYLPETREFEIHSPTLSSSKWWIGALGKTSTHGVVQAKLILPDGKDMGPHLFFVQLRSMDDHRLLPGITAGDIGPKALGGFGATDNGFARFNHVRIPKENMLSKFSQVTDEGKYIHPPHAKISYGGMLYIRSGMVLVAGMMCAKASTVAIRYATVRRQGGQDKDGLEVQTITHPSLYCRLLPILSRAYVFRHLGKNLIKAFDDMSQRLAKGDASLLAELHAITSGLKVLVTTTAIADLETGRRSMGGHGYSAFSGLGRVYADYVPAATYEGENFVLDQQVVRAALKAYAGLFSSSSPPTEFAPSSRYLRLLTNSTNEPPQLDQSSWDEPSTSIILLEWRAALLVNEIAQTIKDMADSSIYQRVSKAVTEAFIAGQVSVMLGLLEGTTLSKEDKRVLRSLYNLYLLTTVESALADLLSFGLLRFPKPEAGQRSGSRDPTRGLRLSIKKTCEYLLPNAIGLTDAFGFTDWELDSALGRYDGRAYEALWERAQAEPLNREEVTDAYEESIKPILLRGQGLAANTTAKL